MNRVASIDALRGLAIATMILINLEAVVLAVEPSFGLRMAGSIAAPIFIMLSGFMVALTSTSRNFRYYLIERGAWILAVGVFVDLVVWQIYPLMSIEVLYLIGVSIPIAYFVSRIRSSQRIIMILLIVALAPILQRILGYTYFPTTFYLSGEVVYRVEGQTGVINHWFVDGWFPIFPWLAFSLIGVELAERIKRKGLSLFTSRLLIAGSVLTVVGVLLYVFIYPDTFIRGSWSELFYPPSVQYAILTTGIAMLIFGLFVAIENRRLGYLFQPLSTMGQASLGIYFAHLFAVSYVATRASGGWWKMGMGQYAISYVMLLFSMWVIAVLYCRVKGEPRKWVDRGMRVIVLSIIVAAGVALLCGYLTIPQGISLVSLR